MSTVSTSPRTRKRKLSPAERAAMQAESLQRARACRSLSNMALVIAAFVERGIPAGEIIPGETVLTFNAWRALGRTVKRGERGVKVPVFYQVERMTDSGERESRKVLTGAAVFHISQTTEITQ